jgi:hypothetical protein
MRQYNGTDPQLDRDREERWGRVILKRMPPDF